MRKTIGMLALLAALAVGTVTAAQADCCKDGGKCCTEGGHGCCKK